MRCAKGKRRWPALLSPAPMRQHNGDTRQPQSHQAGEASARSLVSPSWIHTHQLAWLRFELKQGISQTLPKAAARERIWKTYTEWIQAGDNLGMGREGEGLIHFHDNSHREKKCSLASPQGPELNSQGCQSDQEFNSIYSVGRLSGASVSASGWCPEPAQAEQPESWICLACPPMRDSGHRHRHSFSLIYGNLKLDSQGSLYSFMTTQASAPNHWHLDTVLL